MASTSNSVRTVEEIIHEEADSCYSLTQIINRYQIEGTYLGRDMLQVLVHAMYGPEEQVPNNATIFHAIDSVFSLKGIFEPVSLLYQQTKFLIDYVEDPTRGDGGRKLVEGFIIAIRRTGPPDVWRNVASRDEFSRAWELLSLAVHFRPIKPAEGVSTFRGHFDAIFPRPKTVLGLSDFTINLADILAVDITILKTDAMEEHLEMKGNTLKILTINSFNVFGLRVYSKNRTAKALGISSLGEEILYTCHALYGKDQLHHGAKALELLKFDTEVTSSFGPQILKDADAKPFVLSERCRILQNEINKRRAWFPSLKRDIKKQAEAQPFLFYGGLLAVIFGILQMVQTVMSIWSVVLAIRALN